MAIVLIYAFNDDAAEAAVQNAVCHIESPGLPVQQAQPPVVADPQAQAPYPATAADPSATHVAAELQANGKVGAGVPVVFGAAVQTPPLAQPDKQIVLRLQPDGALVP